MHFLYILWSVFLLICDSQPHVNRIWLVQDADLEVRLDPEIVHVFCFARPDLSSWFRNCLKDFNVNFKINEISGSWKPGLTSVDIYDLSYQDLGQELTCSSLESLSSESSPFDIFSFLISSTSLVIKKTTLTPSGFNWTGPSYSSACIAACTKSRLVGYPPSVVVKVRAVVNQKHLFFTFLGLVFIFGANLLSSNITFYYFSGCSFVVLTSLLILMIIFIRILPFRRGGAILQTAVFLIGGTFSLILMALDYVRSSVLQFLTDNIELTFIYAISVVGLSLIFFYWLHLPERLVVNYPRTKTIMKYFLQILGASMIISSIHSPFTEEELLLLLTDFLPSAIHSVIMSPTAIQILKRLSPKFVWIAFVTVFVLCINAVELMYSRLFGTSSKMEFSFSTIKNGRIDLPGSPWASSSPCHCHHSNLFDTGKRHSIMNPLPSRTSFTRVYSPARDSGCPDEEGLFRRAVIHAENINEYILTDDESG